MLGLSWAGRAPSWDWVTGEGGGCCSACLLVPLPRGKEAGSSRLGRLRRMQMSRAALTLARRRPSAGTGSRPTWRAWRGSTAWSSTRTAMRLCVSGPATAGGQRQPGPVSLARDCSLSPRSRASRRPPPAPRASPSLRPPRGHRGPIRRRRERCAAQRAAAAACAHEALRYCPAGCPVSARLTAPSPPRPAP